MLTLASRIRYLSSIIGRSFSATSKNTPEKKSRRFLKLSLGVGALGYTYYTYMNFRDAMEKQSVYNISPYKLALFRTVPLSCMTSFAGFVASLRVPVWLRRPFYGAFAKMYDCNLVECEPLETYNTFNEFFTRPLKSGTRPLSPALLVSPADGQILAFGRLDNNAELYPEQVKGVKYPLKTFLGEQYKGLKGATGNDLYYCSVYLAPGSYHRFHSPADSFKVESVERIPGEVLPVAPWVMRLLPGLVTLNERAIVSGSWKYGRMIMTPVGATNVRSIKLRWDQDDGLGKLGKGDYVGKFEMGSLVVLIFEGPKDFTWNIQPDQWIKFGEALGSKPPSTLWWPF